ncbi:metal-dependent hydrolase [Halohasta salina]|uniref:metal-dependent hydrolase n=1 Tax=Halohasta salina TaxID=2961621 RepID=UPI0020A3B31F|nr:metal-dependent hydrolase [Halohasta salina]
MPTSVVHAAFAVVLAVGLLGAYYDRRALAVVLAVIVAPELDSALGFVMPGAHRTVLHTMVLAAVLAGFVYWDSQRSESWLRGRWGEYGVRVAWVALFAHVFAHIALDWTHLDGINIVWPLVDQFVALDGELYLSSEGLVQTFIDISVDPTTGQQVVDAGQSGTTQSVHVSTPVQPSKEPVGPVDRRFPIAVGGWQLYFLCIGLFVLLARRRQSDE